MKRVVVALLVLATALLQNCAVEGLRSKKITKPVLHVGEAGYNVTFMQERFWAKATERATYAGRRVDGSVGKSSHIISGVKSSRGQFPWQAGMDIDNDFFCGGSLITPEHILTAAHCCEGSKKYVVVLGAQNREADEKGRVSLQTSKAVIHKSFDSESLQNDIAIVFLPKKVTPTKFIKLVNLPPKSQAVKSFVGASALVSGWGKTSDDSEDVSPVLEHVKLNVLSIQDCMQVYGATSIYRSNICASGDGEQATCQGDSGGPLVTREADGSYTQIGVVSYGAATGCEMGYPDVFTRVTSFLPWITAQLEANGASLQKGAKLKNKNAKKNGKQLIIKTTN